MSSARILVRARVNSTVSAPSRSACSRIVDSASFTSTIGYAHTRGAIVAFGLPPSSGRQRRQLADQTLEELVHQHLCDAGQHALSNTRQHSADLSVAIDFDAGRVAPRLEGDPGGAFDEPGPT